jgi:hypothetical protein
MTCQVNIFTEDRDDLIHLAHSIMRAIDPSQLNNPARPVRISVFGSGNGGKSIFYYIATDKLLDSHKTMKGSRNLKAIWSGLYNNNPCEVSFVNTANCRHENHILPERQHGGIEFIQNSGYGIYDIEIHMLNFWDYTCSHYSGRLSQRDAAFKGLFDKDMWARFVEITVRNSALLEYPAMSAFLNKFKHTETMPKAYSFDRLANRIDLPGPSPT